MAAIVLQMPDVFEINAVWRRSRRETAPPSGATRARLRKKNPDRRLWVGASAQTTYQLLATPGGEVFGVPSARELDGVSSQSTLEFVLDLVTLIDGYFLVRATGARAARGSPAPGADPAFGDDWMDEVADVIRRVGKIHFPKGIPLE
jgi:hypothetical protein